MTDIYMDGSVIVEVIEDCGCVQRTHPDGRITDSGCGWHMPHWSGEADGVEWEDIEGEPCPWKP